MKLTKTIIEQSKPKEKEYILWDRDIKGFGIRIHPTGNKSFIVFFRLFGYQKKITLGRYPFITLKEAQEIARKIILNAKQGTEISIIQAKKTTLLFEEFCEKFMTDYVEEFCKPKTIHEYSYTLKKYIIPILKKKPLLIITRQDIVKLHLTYKRTPRTANLCLSIISKLMNFAEEIGLRKQNTNPVKFIKRYKENKRERYLSIQELQNIGFNLIRMKKKYPLWNIHNNKEAKKQYSPEIADFFVLAIKLLLLTGARVNEIVQLTWDEVDFEKQQLKLKDSKTGAKVIILSDSAINLLKEHKSKYITIGSEYIILGKGLIKPMGNINGIWHKFRDACGISDIRLHDLRHTFASIAINKGINLKIIGGLLGHTQINTTERYAHLIDSNLRLASEEVSNHLIKNLQE